MRLLLDSCISSYAVKDLRAAGFDVLWIPEAGKDPGDDEILQKAYTEDLTIVTADKDFGDLIFVFNKPHPSIIRLVDIPARNQGGVLLKVIDTHKEDIMKKALITVDLYRIRIRSFEEA